MVVAGEEEEKDEEEEVEGEEEDMEVVIGGDTDSNSSDREGDDDSSSGSLSSGKDNDDDEGVDDIGIPKLEDVPTAEGGGDGVQGGDTDDDDDMQVMRAQIQSLEDALIAEWREVASVFDRSSSVRNLESEDEYEEVGEELEVEEVEGLEDKREEMFQRTVAQRDRVENGEMKITRWRQMVARFKDKFIMGDYELELFKMLQNLKQRIMSVKEYTEEFYKVMINGSTNNLVEEMVEKPGLKRFKHPCPYKKSELQQKESIGQRQCAGLNQGNRNEENKELENLVEVPEDIRKRLAD
ncbi:uncharacterized protein LOC131028527 [Cryptomeria japonica]|uniref:uncharacterized protein LOC131028527 n=1 Tax=Cryptomeria japonica TaxID=3369 RepID=UPI0027DA032A|nr:uncharacterized protein LOC131028527 [Cryptomeria japonica]